MTRPLDTRTDLLAAFERQHVLVLGDAILDEYLFGDCSRLSPEAPVPVLRVSGTRYALGGAANTAANVASLGGRVTLLGVSGHDDSGERLARLVADSGIAFHPLVDGRPTLRKTRVVGQHQQLVRLDHEDSREVSVACEDQALDRFETLVGTCDVVVLSDYAKGFLTPRLCAAVIARAHAAGRHVVIDPRPQHRDRYVGCDYLTPNWKESLALLGWTERPASEAAVQEAGEALSNLLGASVLMTLGAGGMAFFGREGERFSVPTHAREVFDVSGAGDTVVAAFALAHAAGASHEDAVALANRAAGVVVAKFGTATVRREELMPGDETAGRLIPRAELAGLSAMLRRRGKRIVTINGSFDLLHPGHLYILREAKLQGDVLIVGLNSDGSVRRYKGQDRPIVPEGQRADMLLALRFVDYVHVFDEVTPNAFIEEVRPDVHVNGAEYGENCVEAETVRRVNARLHLVGRIPGFSSTKLRNALSEA